MDVDAYQVPEEGETAISTPKRSIQAKATTSNCGEDPHRIHIQRPWRQVEFE